MNLTAIFVVLVVVTLQGLSGRTRPAVEEGREASLALPATMRQVLTVAPVLREFNSRWNRCPERICSLGQLQQGQGSHRHEHESRGSCQRPGGKEPDGPIGSKTTAGSARIASPAWLTNR
jgi:hypothetical protein